MPKVIATTAVGGGTAGDYMFKDKLHGVAVAEEHAFEHVNVCERDKPTGHCEMTHPMAQCTHERATSEEKSHD